MNKNIKSLLDKLNIKYEKAVASVFNSSGQADLTFYLPNGQVGYLELKGFNKSNKYQLSTLQKIFLMTHSQQNTAFYINSEQTYDNFVQYISQFRKDTK